MSQALLEVCLRHRDLIVDEWNHGIRELESFAQATTEETHRNVERCFDAFVAILEGEGEARLEEFASQLAARRFETGFHIFDPLAAVNRFRRGLVATTRAGECLEHTSLWVAVDELIDAFNRCFTSAFAARLVRSHELRLRELFDDASDGLIHFDAAGVLGDANLGLERILGIERKEWIGRCWLDLLEPSERSHGQELLASVAAGRNVRDAPLRFRHSSGNTVKVRLSGHRSEPRHEGRVIAVLRDVTHEEALRAHVVQAEKLAAIGQLAASMAHELNNPLTWVLGNVSQALDNLDSAAGGDLEATTAMLRDARIGAQRMAGIVKDLRTFARTEPGPATRCSIPDLVDLALRVTGPSLRQRANVDLVLDRSAPRIVGHPGRLAQVFVNLFVNAAEAMAHRPIAENRLLVTTRVDGGDLVVEIADNGPGIAAEVAPHVFEPFYSTKGDQGTGLGLWVCRTIVEEHAGTLELESESEPGQTTFRIRFPIQTERRELQRGVARAG